MNVIVSVCIQEEDRFLIVQEGHPKAYGLWNLPGGHLDENENLLEGAMREAKEETGLEIEMTGVLSIQRNIKSDTNIVRIVFNAKKIGGEIAFDKNEILETRWVTPDEVERMDTNTLRESDLFLDNVEDLKKQRNYPLDMIKSFREEV